MIKERRGGKFAEPAKRSRTKRYKAVGVAANGAKSFVEVEANSVQDAYKKIKSMGYTKTEMKWVKPETKFETAVSNVVPVSNVLTYSKVKLDNLFSEKKRRKK